MTEIQKRVLVVDDDENARHLVSLLRNRGLMVDEAVDGEEALAHLRRNDYAVVLVDPVLRADGVLKSEDLRSRTVLLVVTAADRSELDGLDSEHIHGIVRKPFDPQELEALVVACVEIRGRGTLETMALAMMSGAPLLAWLQRLD